MNVKNLPSNMIVDINAGQLVVRKLSGGGPGSGRRAGYGELLNRADQASKKADRMSSVIARAGASASAIDHGNAGDAHEAAAKWHEAAAKSAPEPSSKEEHQDIAEYHHAKAKEHWDNL